jgi:pimeloyl-ACP methyl ester carboxylesterase
MNPVIVLHGLWLPGTELGLLRRRLASAGFEPVKFRYHSVAEDLDASAARLAECLAGVPGERVHLLGHSLGGLVMLKLLERFGTERIGRLVCLASPFSGSAAGINLTRLPGGARMLGKAMAQVLAESPQRYWHGQRDLGIVAGRVPFGAGRLLGRLPLPHDGTVAVAETQLRGATDHIVLPVTHFSILWSRAVADQVIAFLETGRFSRP